MLLKLNSFLKQLNIQNIKSMNENIITHKGKEIYFMNFAGMKKADEIKAVIETGKKYFHSFESRTALSLADITEMHFNSEIKDLFFEYIKSNKPFVKASAIIGVTGLKQYVFNGVTKLAGRDVKSFDNETQAKEWLIKQM